MFGERLLHYLVRKSCIIYLLIGVSSLFTSYPQNIDSQFATPTFEYLSSEDGLPENSVTCILQDHLGYLWLGTQNGLVRYDGYSMKVFHHDKNDSSSISSGGISAIYEDKNKTLWVGTWDGLNKFNRYKETFTAYKHNKNDKNSISSNWIKSIYEDDNRRFWIGTNEGLNLFDREKQSFSSFYLTDQESKKHISINAIIKDPLSDDLLIGINAAGLWRFATKEKILSKYKFNTPNVHEEKIGWIQSFYKSKNGKIWMASWHTLSSLDPNNKEFKSYFDFPLRANRTHNGSICPYGSLIEDRFGFIWCGFWELGKGIFCLNPKTKNYQLYKLYSGTVAQNMILSLYEDYSGIIWIGTALHGLAKWDRRKYKFHVLKHDPENLNSLSDSIVYKFSYDPKGFIWFATSKALDKLDISSGKFQHYLKNKDRIIKYIYHLIIGKSGDIWIGHPIESGLVKFNPADGSCRSYFNNPKDSINLINKRITYLFQDHLGFIWIATEFGLYRYDINNNKLSHYIHDSNDSTSLSDNHARLIYEDSFGNLWIGTINSGLDKFDRNTEKFTHWGLKHIMAIYEDKKKNFWVADYFSGLNLYDRSTGKIRASYSQKDGLAYNSIRGILEDDHNNLWLATESGLSKFSIDNRTFRNYNKADGLTDDKFWGDCCIDANGIIYFGTDSGIIYFHPDSIKDDPVPPKVVISKVSLLNRPGEKIKYKGFISELKEITLPYNQNDLRFDYDGLQFSEPGKNKYKHILENFDKDWVDAGTQRNAVYTNLDPGKYIFRVIAANRDGIWNKEGASITIIITPPWWETAYAYILYTLIIISIIYFTWRLQLKRIRVKHEFEMSRFEAEKLHEVDELKSRFFTNISHEFRTPLTLILGPVKQIIERIKDEKTKNELQVVHKNAKSLLGLVNELLDVSKLESGNMKLQASPQNIIPLLKALVHSFCSYAERKRINLKFNCKEDEIIAYIDKEKVEKIITNLLSNAFKFTPEEGKIEVTVTLQLLSVPPWKQKEEKCHFEGAQSDIPTGDREIFSKRKISPPTAKIKNKPGRGRNDNIPFVSPSLREGIVEISIRDNGIGIPKENFPKIFDRFYQVNGGHTREQEGTGIGLSLTKELVELHKAIIEVESEEGKGTTFTISIPLGKNHLKAEEICEVNGDEVQYISQKSGNIDEYEMDLPAVDLISEAASNNGGNPVLLIVEDNSDIRNYVKNILEKDYKIFEAIDGEDGWNKSVENLPDLIISDVMMPKMDGFQLCNKLKTDERTSHIPVILLTAKAAKQDKIEGFETGADEYIMKPFETDELKARIKNLVEQRKRIHDYFKKHGIIELEKSNITSIDKKFLQKATEVIIHNISNTSFGIELFAEQLGVSKSLLHKKIVSLTGESPGELIRIIRLKKAADLIKNKSGNISEIAFEVGFNNPAYFSECFKRQFGITPSQYYHNYKSYT